MLACRWETLKAGGFAAADLERLVTLPLRKFCARNIDARAIAEGTISPWSSISDVLTREYDELFGHTQLPALPDNPRTIFNTTNLQTGRDFRISKKYMAESRPIRRVACAPDTSSSLASCAVRRLRIGASTRDPTSTPTPTRSGTTRLRPTD